MRAEIGLQGEIGEHPFNHALGIEEVDRLCRGIPPGLGAIAGEPANDHLPLMRQAFAVIPVLRTQLKERYSPPPSV